MPTRPLTIGLADPAGNHPDSLTRVERAAKKAGLNARILFLDSPAQAAQLAQCDVVLLIGLAHARSNASTETAHAQFRMALSHASLPYQVIYGMGDEQLARPLAFIQREQTPAASGARPGSTSGESPPMPRTQWAWACDKCSDPQCEHRLLTDLIQQRRSAA